MTNLLIYILILCILNSILFYGKTLGLNVILFMIPLIIFIIYTLKSNQKLINKKGLLFIIPILLLSTSYFIYNNSTFRVLNVPVIICLYILMYIYTIKPKYSLKSVIKDSLYLIFRPIGCIANFYRVVNNKLSDTFKISDSKKSKIKSVLIVIPIVIVVLLLLSSADMMFNNIFSNFFDLFKYISFGNIFGRLILILLLFTYLGASINYILFNYEKEENTSKEFTVQNFTIKLLLTILNVIYIVFDFIQIRSLIFHQVSTNINYAQYAREGFFQLMFISFINVIILLISKKCKNDNEKKYNNTMSIIMVILTLVIIMSSFIRMHMYESTYGYTMLRLLVYVTLITEIILLIPTIIYILNPNVKIIKHYIIIITTAYTLLNLLPVDYFITYNNINRYYKTNKIDIEYLSKIDSDLKLIDLYNDSKLNDNQKNQILDNFKYKYKVSKTKGIQEFNISKKLTHDKLEEIVGKNKWDIS